MEIMTAIKCEICFQPIPPEKPYMKRITRRGTETYLCVSCAAIITNFLKDHVKVNSEVPV